MSGNQMLSNLVSPSMTSARGSVKDIILEPMQLGDAPLQSEVLGIKRNSPTLPVTSQSLKSNSSLITCRKLIPYTFWPAVNPCLKSPGFSNRRPSASIDGFTTTFASARLIHNFRSVTKINPLKPTARIERAEGKKSLRTDYSEESLVVLSNVLLQLVWKDKILLIWWPFVKIRRPSKLVIAPRKRLPLKDYGRISISGLDGDSCVVWSNCGRGSR